MVAFVKARHRVFDTPIELAPTQTVAEALSLIPKRAHRAAVVTQDGHPLGVVAEADCADVDRFAQVQDVMNPTMVTIGADTDPRVAFEQLDAAAHAPLAVAVDGAGRLVGVLTRIGALRATLYTPALDHDGALRIAAAVGVNGDVAAKAASLLDAGVDCLVLDTAHGHQERMIEALRAVRGLDPQVPVVAGNVVSREGTEALLDAGADIVKVGVGPGRDVHDADDDRGRPPAVLRRPRVRHRGPRARGATSGRTAASGTPVTSPWRWPPAPPR